MKRKMLSNYVRVPVRVLQNGFVWRVPVRVWETVFLIVQTVFFRLLLCLPCSEQFTDLFYRSCTYTFQAFCTVLPILLKMAQSRHSLLQNLRPTRRTVGHVSSLCCEWEAFARTFLLVVTSFFSLKGCNSLRFRVSGLRFTRSFALAVVVIGCGKP